MILAAILLQHAVPGLPEAAVIPGPAPRFRHPTAPGVAIGMFRDVCLSNLRDRSAVAKAARRAGLRLSRESRSDLGGDTYERGDLTLHYETAGSLHPRQDQPQCIVRAWLDGKIGEGAFERRFVANVKPGDLKRSEPVRIWERAASDGRIEVIGLQTYQLRHGQIGAILSTGLRPEQSH